LAKAGCRQPDRLGPVKQIDAVWRKKAGAGGGAGDPKKLYLQRGKEEVKWKHEKGRKSYRAT